MVRKYLVHWLTKISDKLSDAFIISPSDEDDGEFDGAISTIIRPLIDIGDTPEALEHEAEEIRRRHAWLSRVEDTPKGEATGLSWWVVKVPVRPNPCEVCDSF